MKKAKTHNSNILANLFDKIDKRELAKVNNRMLLSAKIADRLKELGINKTEFAKLVGKEKSVITKWLSGTHNFTSDTLVDIECVLSFKLMNREVIVHVATIIKENEQVQIISPNLFEGYNQKVEKQNLYSNNN